jgi:2-dehydro-3-deoxygluconokinase
MEDDRSSLRWRGVGSGAGPASGLTEDLPLGVGGAELNVAVAVRGAGRSVRYATRVGDDPFDALAEAALLEAEVGVLLERNPVARTGFYLRTDRIDGRVGFYPRRGSAGSRLPRSGILRAAARDARVLHPSGITAALCPGNLVALGRIMDDAHSAGCRISFDVNYRSALWPRELAAPVLTDLALDSDLVWVGADEAEELWGSCSADEVLSLLPVPELVYKDGDRRRIDIFEAGRARSFGLPEVSAVDSVGAGALSRRATSTPVSPVPMWSDAFTWRTRSPRR